MDKYKKLLKNSGIFAIANFGSKLISIILVPLYTYVLAADEYGIIDMIINTVSLFIPIITLSIFEATLRFSAKSNHSKSEVLTNSIIVALIGEMIFLLFYHIFSYIGIFGENLLLFYFLVLVQSLNMVLSQFARGIGKVKVFAINGVLNTIITIIFNIILLVKLSMGVQGYLLSIIIANLVCNLYLYVAINLRRFINIKLCNKEIINSMIIYSIPLIPNALMWWIMNASDRYAITFLLGVAANGIYALAYKVPTTLNLLSSIFFQAWQLSAIEEDDDKSKSLFYTKVFNVFSLIMLIGTSAILVVVKFIFNIAISPEFKDAWEYTPFLLLAVVFSSFSSFLGTNYVAMQRTKGAFKTSVLGAILNISLNYIAIPLVGINGAALSTMVSFFVIWILRYFDTREFVKISIDIKKMMLNIFIIAIQIAVLYLQNDFYIIIEILLFISLLVANRGILKVSMLKFYRNIIKSNTDMGNRAGQ